MDNSHETCVKNKENWFPGTFGFNPLKKFCGDIICPGPNNTSCSAAEKYELPALVNW